jgi:hypothetical protein
MSISLLRFFAIFLLIVPLGMNAQTSKKMTYKSVKYKANVDAPLTNSEMGKIKEVYQESAKKEVLDSPIRVKQLKHLLRNRIRIIKIDIREKQRPCQLLSDIELFNPYNKALKREVVFNKENFNPLKYNFNFYPSATIMYRVDGTNYYIQIKSQFQ